MKNDNLIEKAVEIMNQALAADKETITRMCLDRKICTQALAAHPTIQVGMTEQGPEVGLLGILNGILEPITENRMAVIIGKDEKTGEDTLEKFIVYEKFVEKA